MSLFSFHQQTNEFEWHKHMQIYVATLSVLHNISKRKQDLDEESQKISEELGAIFHNAQQLLCSIETFINGTMGDGISKIPMDWWTDEEIRNKVKIKDPEDPKGIQEKISYLFVAGRFQQYINRLSDRIKNFKISNNKKHLRSARRNFRYRRCMRNQKNKQKCLRFKKAEKFEKTIRLTTNKSGKINPQDMLRIKSTNQNRRLANARRQA